MRRETALLIWWAVGWGGWIDGKMLSSMRRCSPRGARDVLAAAASRGWLQGHYVNSRCVMYRATEIARIAAAAELQAPSIAKLQGFRAKIADGQFVPPGGWPHAREAAIATAKLAEIYRPYFPIEPYWVIPMCLLPQVTLEKTPDAMLIGQDYCTAFEYERSRKTGRAISKHSTWVTLERYIGDVSEGRARFYENQVTDIIIQPHNRCAGELKRHLDKHCGAMATERDQIIKWGWLYDGSLERREALPGEPCD